MGNAIECCCKKAVDKPICEFDNNTFNISCCTSSKQIDSHDKIKPRRSLWDKSSLKSYFRKDSQLKSKIKPIIFEV